MTFYQLAFCYLKRKKAKTVLLFFVLLLVSSMILSTSMIIRAAQDSKAAIQEKAGSKIVLEITKKDNKITQREAEEILHLEEVSAVNCQNRGQAFPDNFYPVTASDSMEENNQKITLFSYDDLENDSAFYEGRYRLVSGRYITKDKRGAVINSLLADSNGLELGDDIKIENAEGRMISLKITGLFLSGSERKQTEKMDSADRIENQIFTDNESFSQLLGNTGYYKVSVYCKNPKQLSMIEEQLRSVLSEKVSYTSSDTLYRQMALPLDQITRAANLMLVLTLITGIVTVSLLLCMWMRTRQKEAAIFTSIGKSKYSIFLQVFLESFLVFMVSITGACGLGSLMAGLLQKVLTHSQTTEISMHVVLQGKDIGSLMIWGSCIVLAAVAVSLFPILKADPRDILSGMEG